MNPSAINALYKQIYGQGIPGEVWSQIQTTPSFANQFTQQLQAIQQAGGITQYAQGITDPAQIQKLANMGLMSSQQANQYQTTLQQGAANQQYNSQLQNLSGSTALQPNSEIQQAEQLIQKQISNPTQLSPQSVQTWEQFINQANAPANAQQNTLLNEQYAGLGNLGGSQNRSALANAMVNQNSNTANQALTLAQQQQQNTQQQGQQNVSNLLDVGQSKQNLSLIPLQAQYNALSAEYNQGNTQSNAILNNTLQAQTQEQQMQEMEALTQQNQPAQTPWYQPLITGGLTALGTALGGPVGGALANGVSGLFGANSQPSSTTNYGSLFNTNSQLNLNSNFNSNLFQNSAPQFTGSFFGGK